MRPSACAPPHAVPSFSDPLPSRLIVIPMRLSSWIGSRLLNRLMRQHCQDHGLFLSAHALLVTQPDKPLYLHDRATGTTRRIPEEGGICPAVVPYEYLQTESDLLWLLGRCTAAFSGLIDPRNRNA